VFQDRTTANVVHVNAKYVADHDGLANTLLVSENLLPAQSWVVPPPSDAATARKLGTFVWFENAPATAPASYKINTNKSRMPKTIPANLEWSRPSSNHSGGVLAAFCDGHVQFLSDEIDYNVYKQLMTPNSAASGATKDGTLPLDPLKADSLD
jgi:prepilin-type processing-associated H-X9-DG protein